MVTKVEIPGMPMAMPPQTLTECLSKQDPIPKTDASGQDCKIKDMEQTKDTVTWKMECKQDGRNMVSNGKMVYKGDTFEGTIIIDTGAQGGNMVMTTTITGKRIGDCQ